MNEMRLGYVRLFVSWCLRQKRLGDWLPGWGITDIKGIKRCTALGSQCGKCVRQAKEIIEESLIAQFKLAS